MTSPALRIAVETPLSEDAASLIAGSQAALEAVYSADEIFTLTPEELVSPNIQLLVARIDGRPVGCVALADMVDYGEIKRLYVTESARGHGVAKGLVEELEILAGEIGLKVLRLETGPELAAAVRLYQSLGYTERDRFGDYEQVACSMFMEKRLG